MDLPITHYDQKETRCPMLGHGVPFHYCRQLQANLPCHRIMHCWFEKIDIQPFIQSHFTEQEIQAFTAPAKPKITSLIELIEKAKEANE